MVFIFTFLGEFGYELLNWQGVVRKFAGTLSAADQIVCCSRARLHPLYDAAAQYIDISDVPLFRRSVACGYYAFAPGSRRFSRLYDWRLRRQLRQHIASQLSGRLKGAPSRFVFSSMRTELNGCRFGCEPARYGRPGSNADIYEGLAVGNNVFRKIVPDLGVRGAIEQSLGWSLEAPYVLCQTRQRSIVQRSTERVHVESLLPLLAERLNVVLLSFRTGRQDDSYSGFDQLPNMAHYAASSFLEQACLIHFAHRCLFFTEGDFGSHIYVPPFLGKDVYAVAPKSVYELGTTPIEFWNRNVFRFGGVIRPRIAEDVFASPSHIRRTIDELLSN
jgi:hypothetical protein